MRKKPVSRVMRLGSETVLGCFLARFATICLSEFWGGAFSGERPVNIYFQCG